MLGRLFAALALLVGVGMSVTAQAQTQEACQVSIGIWQRTAASVKEQAADPAAALAARAEAVATERAAYTACDRLGPQAYSMVSRIGEDMDFTLGSAVPACKAAMDAAESALGPVQVIVLGQDKVRAKTQAPLVTAARQAIEEPCKDYPGVLRVLRRAEDGLAELVGN